MSDSLHKLCQAVAAISPGIEIRIRQSAAEPDEWSVVVAASDAILVCTDYGPLDVALGIAVGKLAGISTRMMAAVRPSEPPEPQSS